MFELLMLFTQDEPERLVGTFQTRIECEWVGRLEIARYYQANLVQRPVLRVGREPAFQCRPQQQPVKAQSR